MYISGCATYNYPIEVINGYLVSDEKAIVDFPLRYPYQGEWGYPVIAEKKDFIMKEGIKLHLSYISVVESRMYTITKEFDYVNNSFISDFIKNKGCSILVGMAPFGGIALWLYMRNKSILINWLSAQLSNERAITPFDRKRMSISDICQKYISEDSIVKDNFERNGIPPRNLFDKYMQQFTLRYSPLFAHWDENKSDWTKYEEDETKPEFDYIEESLFDGTHDKLHDGGLMNYHQAGKPKKLAVKWHIKKSEYMAYFWFDDEEICKVFDRFYGLHPETKTEFMIRIDVEQNKYELALYRYGLKEPQVINESAYQLIVFKNKFEYFRSENYDQPRGAWIW